MKIHPNVLGHLRAGSLGAFTAILVAGAAALDVSSMTGCTKAQVQSADAVAIDLTGAVCTALEGQPAGQPFVDLGCTLAGVVENGISVLDSSGKPATHVVFHHIPAAQAAAILAAHGAPADAGQPTGG
jgi:hypothetical protein